MPLVGRRGVPPQAPRAARLGYMGVEWAAVRRGACGVAGHLREWNPDRRRGREPLRSSAAAAARDELYSDIGISEFLIPMSL